MMPVGGRKEKRSRARAELTLGDKEGKERGIVRRGDVQREKSKRFETAGGQGTTGWGLAEWGKGDLVLYKNGGGQCDHY